MAVEAHAGRRTGREVVHRPACGHAKRKAVVMNDLMTTVGPCRCAEDSPDQHSQHRDSQRANHAGRAIVADAPVAEDVISSDLTIGAVIAPTSYWPGWTIRATTWGFVVRAAVACPECDPRALPMRITRASAMAISHISARKRTCTLCQFTRNRGLMGVVLPIPSPVNPVVCRMSNERADAERWPAGRDRAGARDMRECAVRPERRRAT